MESQSTSSLAFSIVLLLSLLTTQTQGSNVDPMGEDTGNMGVDEALSVGKQKERPLWLRQQRPNGRRIQEEEEDKQDDSFLELIKEGPWALIQLKGRTNNYTPRLGRDNQDEEMGFTKTSRSPPFAPRLGRRHKMAPGFLSAIPNIYNNK